MNSLALKYRSNTTHEFSVMIVFRELVQLTSSTRFRIETKTVISRPIVKWQPNAKACNCQYCSDIFIFIHHIMVDKKCTQLNKQTDNRQTKYKITQFIYKCMCMSINKHKLTRLRTFARRYKYEFLFCIRVDRTDTDISVTRSSQVQCTRTGRISAD